MTAPLEDVGLACLPAAALPDLAAIRCEPGVEVALANGRAWVRWDPGAGPVLRRLLPVPGVRLYFYRDGNWYQPGRHLPDFDLPDDLDFRPLHEVLTPAPVTAVPVTRRAVEPVRLRLVAGSRPRPATALACDLAELARWANTVPGVQLASLQAAHCGGRVLLVGQRLPPLPGARRFWGQAVLVPLGWRPEPDLPGSALREAFAVGDDELLVLDLDRADARSGTGCPSRDREGAAPPLPDGRGSDSITGTVYEVIPRGALRPLSRAGIRLAAGEGA